MQFKHGLQALDNFGIGIGLNLEPDRIALARILFLQVEVAVAGDAKGRRGNNVITAIHAHRMVGDQVSKENEIRAALGG